jgi:type IV pilus assembly protein PilM
LTSRVSAPASSRQANPLRRMVQWLEEPPHPRLVCEISASGVSAARLGGRRVIESHAFEPVEPDAVVASPVEMNIANPAMVGAALNKVLSKIGAQGSEFALIIPDEVVRVFLLQFESLPRKAAEAVPLLRFRLRKSVPFDTEDSSVSYSIQPAGPPSAPEGSIHVLAAIARQKIIRQYEELLEARQKRVAVVVSSTLASLPLVDDSRPCLLARLCGNTLTTVIVHAGSLAVYRCTSMHGTADTISAQSVLDEVYPAIAYFQDTWGTGVAEVRLAGLGLRTEEFRAPLEAELQCRVAPVVPSASVEGRLAGEERAQVDGRMEAIVGWMLFGEG